MIRLRPYKSGDAGILAEWVRDENVFMKWGGHLFGDYPISARIIDEKYTVKNGDCPEPDNFYPWIALDDENRVVGHFIMRYMNGDIRTLRFGWVVVDPVMRGQGIGTRMLRQGLKYAFEIMGADRVTLGVYENNGPAHRCYMKAGFADRTVVEKEPWNVIEMEMDRKTYQCMI